MRSSQYSMVEMLPQQNKHNLSDLWKRNDLTTECDLTTHVCMSACAYLFALNARLWDRYTNSGQPCVHIMSKMRNTWGVGVLYKINKRKISLSYERVRRRNKLLVRKWPQTENITHNPREHPISHTCFRHDLCEKHKSSVSQTLPKSDVAWWSTNIITQMSNL